LSKKISMQTTKDVIINLADDFIRDKGYNAFSFNDISKGMGIKTASIHYHFPSKSDLGVSVIRKHRQGFEGLKKKYEGKGPEKKLEAFFSIYSQLKSENKICLVGSLATDFNTVDKKVKSDLKLLAAQILDWVTEILIEGKQKRVFNFKMDPRTKAILIITNMLAIVQLSRLTTPSDVDTVKKAITRELKSAA
jgi:TetR/AcrR family transcriptional repressor of nem operon